MASFNELQAQFLYERGQISASAKKYREVLNMVGNSNLIRLKLAESLIHIKTAITNKEAIGQLKAILAMEPRNTAAINKLGIAYGKKGDLATSYLYLAESAIISKKLENSKFYLAKAEQLVDKQSADYSKLKRLKAEAITLVEK